MKSKPLMEVDQYVAFKQQNLFVILAARLKITSYISPLISSGLRATAKNYSDTKWMEGSIWVWKITLLSELLHTRENGSRTRGVNGLVWCLVNKIREGKHEGITTKHREVMIIFSCNEKQMNKQTKTWREIGQTRKIRILQ